MGPVHGPDTDLAILESRGPDGAGLRITFLWQEDRYGHEIAYVDDQTASTLLVTERESAGLPWPGSPPLQQISWLETAPGRRVALLVGMAGKSHWSFSVEADRGMVGLVLDVACRVQCQPEWLGSTYRCEHAVRRAAEDDLPAWLGHPAAARRLEATATGGFPTAGSLSGQTPSAVCFNVGNRVATVVAESPNGGQPVAIDRSGARLSIFPRLDRINTPVTVRWKYRVALGEPQP